VAKQGADGPGGNGEVDVLQRRHGTAERLGDAFELDHA
jgi:hypothetical protein